MFPSIVKAKKQTTILMISPEIFKKMINASPMLMNNFIGLLSKKIVYLNKKISSYTVGTSENKLAYFIYENEIDGIVSANMSFSDIAVMLDIGRASLYRALEKLESENLIKREGKTIAVLDKENLKKLI